MGLGLDLVLEILLGFWFNGICLVVIACFMIVCFRFDCLRCGASGLLCCLCF